MFNELIEVFKTDKGFIDSQKREYSMREPVHTIELEFFGLPCCNEIPNPEKYLELQKEIEKLGVNAYRNAGVVKTGSRDVETPMLDLDGSEFTEKMPLEYIIRKIEFYYFDRFSGSLC